MATTTNLDTLTINYLTQAQFDAAVSGGTIDANQLYFTPDASITGVTAGTGLSGGGTSGSLTINHSNSVTAKSTQAVYPITFDAQGHITGSGNAVTISDKNVESALSTTATTYYLTGSTSSSTTTGSLNKHTALKAYTTADNGTGGYARIDLGNTTATTSSGGKEGILRLYGTSATYYVDLKAGAPSANRTITFPNATGTVALTSDIPSYSDKLVEQIATVSNNVDFDHSYELLFAKTNLADNATESTTTNPEEARKAFALRYNPKKKVLISDGEIRANRGVFNELVATSLSASSATITDLTTQNATVVGLLDVKGQLHSNSWTNANIANIGGSFYITPTIEPTDSQAKITITRNSATSWTVTLSGTFATNTIKTGTSSSGVAWPANSLILITGNITFNDIEYPLGTLKGTLQSQVTATASGTSKTVTLTGVTDGQGNTTPAILQRLYELNSNTNISNATLTSGKISLYQIGSYPVGIQMTAMGISANSMIEIYGGVSIQPNVRIGHLEGIPGFNHRLTTDTSVNSNKKYYTYSGGNFTVVNNPSGNPQTNGWYEADEPKGWGIYTDNGYFTGVIVATAGKIGQGANAWRIGNDVDTGKAMIYTGTRGNDNSAYISTGIGTESIANSGNLNSDNDGYWAFTAGASFGVTTKGKLYANQAHIRGSIDATSFIARDGNDNAIATFNSSGISFGDNKVGIRYVPNEDPDATGDLYISGDKVHFEQFIETTEGNEYYQYTPNSISYKWQIKNTANGSWTNISGATGTITRDTEKVTYTKNNINNSDVGKIVRCIITVSTANRADEVISDSAQINKQGVSNILNIPFEKGTTKDKSKLTIIIQPYDQILSSSESTATFTIALIPTYDVQTDVQTETIGGQEVTTISYYYYTNSNQLISLAENDLDTDIITGEKIIIRRGGLESKIADAKESLEDFYSRLSLEEEYTEDFIARINENSEWIGNTGQTTVTNYNTFMSQKDEIIRGIASTTINNVLADRLKGIYQDEEEPSITIWEEHEGIISSIKIRADSIVIKGESNEVSWITSDSFITQKMVASEFRPSYLNFNDNGVTNIKYSFALIGRENRHLSVIKIASNT